MDKIDKVLAEIIALRTEVDRLHQRLDDGLSEHSQSPSDEEIRYSAEIQLRTWELVKVKMHADMVEMARAGREMLSGQGLRS